MHASRSENKILLNIFHLELKGFSSDMTVQFIARRCCTMSPLVASSGSVMEAGVVRRFLALVSWSITASMSCIGAGGTLEVSQGAGVRSHPPIPAHTDLVDLGPRLEAVALVVAAQQQQRLVHVVPGVLDLKRGPEGRSQWRVRGRWTLT